MGRMGPQRDGDADGLVNALRIDDNYELPEVEFHIDPADFDESSHSTEGDALNTDELPRGRVERDDLGSLRTTDRDFVMFEVIELNQEQTSKTALRIDAEVEFQFEYPTEFVRHLSDAEQHGIGDAMNAMLTHSPQPFRSSWIAEEWLEELTDWIVHVPDGVAEFVWVRYLPFLEYVDLTQRHAMSDEDAGMLNHVIGAVPRFVAPSAFAEDHDIAAELSPDSVLFLSPRL